MTAWERTAKESAVAYEAFIAYRDMGANRSLESVGKKLGKSGGLMERWSAQHDWINRVLAWDDHQQKLIDEAQEQAYQEMVKEWRKKRRDELKVVDSLWVRMVNGLNNRTRKNEKGQDVPAPPTIDELKDIVSIAKTFWGESRIEMNDLPTQRSEHDHTSGGEKINFVIRYPDDHDDDN